jgi:superfamily I DNA/RNA helicase
LIDFDDMPSMPITDDKINPIQWDNLLVDEVQDTNPAQLYLAMNSVSDGGSIIGIGDRRQSIYAFRGADSKAMQKFKEELNADELPLSISYRCPTKIRDLVNTEFPDIQFETPEWAIEGSIEYMQSQNIHETLIEGDMVLCRINADLVPVAFALIRKGIKATIKGKDIGKSLVTLIKKQRADDIPDLMYNLEEFRERQYAKFLKLDKIGKIAQLDDQIATIDVMSEGANSVAELMTRCETLFSDGRSAVTLSTVHKAKGLEAKNVYILRPELMPHPMAKTPEAIAQESNIKYVAITRTQDKLVFVT